LYYLWIALYAAISLISSQFTLQTPFWVYLAFLQNYSFQHTSVEFVWFGVMWSLGVEEQFYLLSPPLIRNAQPHRLWKILLVVVAFSFVLRLFLVTVFGHAAQEYWGLRAATFWTPSRADDLALGMLAALAWRTAPLKQWCSEHVACFKYAVAVCAGLIFVTLFWMVKPNYFFASIVGIPVFSALYLSLLVISLVHKNSFIATVFRSWPLRELGKVSYCVYVIHVAMNWMVHKFVRGDLPRFDGLRSIAVTVLAFSFTMLIAELSWSVFEHPLIRRGHRYTY
jgi:peptidoglycan/LPS O-acetylase OafA/YrhL